MAWMCATPRSTSVQERVGVVTQEAHLFHDTLRANLVYARPAATDEEIRSALRHAQILDAVEALPDGLNTMVGRTRLPLLPAARSSASPSRGCC